jgi:phage protein D
MQVSKTIFQVKYKGEDITPYVTSMDYTDKQDGESDELSINIEDSDYRWQNSWYPTKGDKLSASIKTMDCGTFEIDEINLSGPGDSISIRAIASGISEAMRTKKTEAHEKKTLKEVVTATAKAIGCEVNGEFDDDPMLERVTRHRENALSFLHRIGKDYGYVVAIRDKKLTFTNKQKLEKQEEVLIIDKSAISNYSFTDKTQETFKEAEATYHNPMDREIVSAKVVAVADEIEGIKDTLLITTKAENKQQAEIKAKAQLYNANSQNKTFSISLEGNERLVSGVNIKLTGFGKFGGKFHIVNSRHKVDRSGGYSTSIDGKGVK